MPTTYAARSSGRSVTHGVDAFEVYEFMDASRGDDYEHLMRVCLEWVTIARWHGPRK